MSEANSPLNTNSPNSSSDLNRSRSWLGLTLFAAGIILLLFLNATFLVPLKQLNLPDYGNDMGYFWAAARTAILGGNPYNSLPGSLYHSIRVEAGGDPAMLDQFKNPHYFTLLFAPFAALPLAWAAACWLTFQEFLLGLVVVLIIRLSNLRLTPATLLSGLALSVLCRYTIVSLLVGQSSLLLLFIFALSFYFSRTGHFYLAGACAGLLMVKPQVVFVILPLLLVVPIADKGWKNRETYQRFIGFLLVGLVFATYSFSFQPDWLGEWFKALFSGETAYFNNQDINREMASLRGLAALLVTEPAAIQIVTGLLSLPLWGGVIWLWWRNRNNAGFSPYLLGIGAAVNVMTSPYIRDYDYCLLFFPLLFSFFTLRRLEQSQKSVKFRFSWFLWLLAFLPYILQFIALNSTRAVEVVLPFLLIILTLFVWRKAKSLEVSSALPNI